MTRWRVWVCVLCRGQDGEGLPATPSLRGLGPSTVLHSSQPPLPGPLPLLAQRGSQT